MSKIADQGHHGSREYQPEHAPGAEGAPASEAAESASRDGASPERDDRPVEVGGRGGLDPTRYGDWEKGGRCIDF